MVNSPMPSWAWERACSGSSEATAPDVFAGWAKELRLRLTTGTSEPIAFGRRVLAAGVAGGRSGEMGEIGRDHLEQA